jgi:hypothetical protein
MNASTVHIDLAKLHAQDAEDALTDEKQARTA